MIRKTYAGDTKPPDPKELKKMLEGVFQKFGNASVQTPFTSEEEGADNDSVTEKDLGDIYEFSYLPRDIKAYLDRFIIRQTEAKKALAIAVCDHYNNVKHYHSLQEDGEEVPSSLDFHKQNILITGPTGVGKTYLVKHLADLIGVPFIKADATKFSETGYVGRDVDDLVRDLVKKAGGDVELAEHGIIYIDEIDKLSGASGNGGRDVSGRGVQTTLLKLMEETEVPLMNPMDMQGQMMMMMKGKGEDKKDVINTRHILFIVSGAFSGIDKIIEKRERDGQIGFGAQQRDEAPSDLMFKVETQDFIQYGFEAEFVGRLPVRVHCESLTKKDLANILKYSEGSILNQYIRQFEAYDIQIRFEDDAIDYIAELAEKQNTGARALMTVLESLLRDFKYEMPGLGVSELKVNRDLLENSQKALEKYSKMGVIATREDAMRELKQYSQSFLDEHGVGLSFSEEAVDYLVKMRMDEGQTLMKICQRIFKDYAYGMKLIKTKTGQSKLEATLETVQDPDKFLSALVLKAYQDEQGE